CRIIFSFFAWDARHIIDGVASCSDSQQASFLLPPGRSLRGLYASRAAHDKARSSVPSLNTSDDYILYPSSSVSLSHVQHGQNAVDASRGDDNRRPCRRKRQRHVVANTSHLPGTRSV